MKRQNGLTISDEELESYMTVLKVCFGLKWLEEIGDNPLQILWKRLDILATNELYTLAYSIDTLNKIDASWIKDQVKIAKGRDENNSRGAIFEIIGLSMMHNPNHPVSPARLNQAGFDGILKGDDDTEVRVSIKNYGKSSFQRSFEKKCKIIESKIVLLLKKYKYPPTQVIVDFPSQFPTDKDWKMLEDKIDGVFKDKRKDKDPFLAVMEPLDDKKEFSPKNARVIFLLFITPILSDNHIIHEKYQTYTVLMSAAYHHNEYKNLFSKMDSACANLLKHSATETDNIINSLLLHVPDTISLKTCEQWLTDYFEGSPKKQITFVIIYQPTVAEIEETKDNVIQHSCKIYLKDNAKIKRTYTFSIPVGRISNESADLFYIAEYPDGSKEKFPLTDKYTYQHGEYFIKLQPDGKEGFYGDLKKIGNGVYTNLVIEIPGQKGSAVLSGRFPPSDELLIL